MRSITFTLLAVLVAATPIFARQGVSIFSTDSPNIFVATKIQRCALEDFMVQHRILYHVTLSRSDVTSLILLCKKQTEVQTTLTMK